MHYKNNKHYVYTVQEIQEEQHPLTGQRAANFRPGQPVSRMQAGDAMTSRLPRYEAKCVQIRCFYSKGN